MAPFMPQALSELVADDNDEDNVFFQSPPIAIASLI
jgi:hypothetical protein